MASFVLFFLQLLSRTVQKEPLVEQHPVFFHQLHISHYMKDLPAFMAYPVFHTDTVAFLFQSFDLSAKFFLVFVHNRFRHHIKADCRQFLQRLISQYIKRRPVDTENLLPVQGMAHHTAVHGGKNRFQGMILLNNFPLIGALLGHIDGNPHSSHHTSIQIIQRRFISGEQSRAFPRLHHFLRHTGFPAAHNNAL